MIDLKEWFEVGYQYRLDNVTFYSFEGNNSGQEYRPVFYDDIDYKLVDKKAEVRFTRKLQFEPKGIYDIKVSFIITMTLKDELPGEISDLTKEFEEALQDINCPYMAIVTAKASIVVSQLTMASGQNPFVTPPTFMKRE